MRMKLVGETCSLDVMVKGAKVSLFRVLGLWPVSKLVEVVSCAMSSAERQAEMTSRTQNFGLRKRPCLRVGVWSSSG